MKSLVEKVNIPRSITDPSYRYQMPLLKTEIVGKGINIRTKLVNLKDVSKALLLEPIYILKFMGYELGTQTNVIRDKKTDQILVMSLNGKLDTNDVLECLDKFIEKFLLCDVDKFPELMIEVRKKEVYGKCKSCSAIKYFDPQHKLTTYMRKNPPKMIKEIKDQKGDILQEEGTVVKVNVSKIKFEIRTVLLKNNLNPYDESNDNLFKLIKEYLSLLLPFNEKYNYDDSHKEIIYKAIKRLRLKREKYDKINIV